MRFYAAIVAAIALAIPAISAPTPDSPRVIQKFDGETTGRYIVKLKDGVSHDSVLGQVGSSPTHTWSIINGFAGEFTPEALDIMLSNPDVEYISEDGIGSITAIQTDATWGLGRLSTKDKLTNQNAMGLTFSYNYATTGKGVDVYVVDTGVRTTHKEFGGRAKWGETFGGYPDVDDNSHGTHCAGTVAGKQYGVAKDANIIAVKVFDSKGAGSAADVISGLNWVAQNAATTRRPSVASMSFRFSITPALDAAVESLLTKGIHAIIAAGNDRDDASRYSPPRVRNAITVAASTIADTQADFSNFGDVVDIFAPGQTVISAGNSGDTAVNVKSGTSMATPHVAGLVANLLSRDGNASPSVVAAKLKGMSVQGKLTLVSPGTVNLLAQGV